MRSRAAIGNHPIHPALVPIPIGAFFLLLVGDIAFASTRAPFWYEFSRICLGIGIISALLAAVFGFIDFFGVKMSARGRRVATVHMTINLIAVVAYVVNFFLRMGDAALNTARWPLCFVLEIATFLLLGVSGWLGGNLAYEHKTGVVENLDLEATEIGRNELPAGAVPAETPRPLR